MTTLKEALERYPPSLATTCSSKKNSVPTQPLCPNIQPPITGTSAVHFQIAYTCYGYVNIYRHNI